MNAPTQKQIAAAIEAQTPPAPIHRNVFTALAAAQPIVVGDPWDVEHRIPLALGGDDHGDNLAPAHVACHRAKTATDAGDTARAKRREAKHIGADAPSRAVIPGSKRSPWKRKLSGEVVRRTPDA